MNINLTLLMQAIGFGLFIWFCAKFVWPPLMRAVETRQRQIAEGLQAGEEGRKSLITAEQRVAAMIADARGKAGEIVATGEKFKAETIDQAKVEAQAERERIVAAAKAEAAQEYQMAREQLRNQVADLAVAGAARILQREIDPRAHAQLLDEIRREL
ncbi:MAG TPA: F0F1 ATP synthase subunit B [Casimicrobiaceae bacterium]|nr:F0F1 ATP synthase subunit B [Casimicrobiaceae bacterium]